MRSWSADPVERIPYPNSARRDITLFGLGSRSVAVTQNISDLDLPGVTILSDAGGMFLLNTTNAVLAVLDQKVIDLGALKAISVQTCHRGLLLTTVVLLQADGTPIDKNWLFRVREASDILVITDDDDYPSELVQSLIPR